jgi:hypothetical protein
MFNLPEPELDDQAQWDGLNHKEYRPVSSSQSELSPYD